MRLENILIYRSVFDTMEKLTDEQAGKLIKKIGEWGKGNDDYHCGSELLEGYFMALEPNLIQLKNNYDRVAERNKENGKKGGRPRKPKETQTNRENPMGYLETQETHTNPENLKERDKEKEREKERERESVPHNTATQFNKLQSYFDDNPRYYGSNRRVWDELHPFEQQQALEKAEQYIKWETRDKKDLGFYLRDRKWELDLTTSTKNTNVRITDPTDPNFDWSDPKNKNIIDNLSNH